MGFQRGYIDGLHLACAAIDVTLTAEEGFQSSYIDGLHLACAAIDVTLTGRGGLPDWLH